MITRVCTVCKAEMVANKENVEGAVFFEEKYYHKDCFINMCQQKIGNNRCKKKNWQGHLDNITQWQDEARQLMKAAVDKDEVYDFFVKHYHISCTNSTFFTRLSAIYNGTYSGLAYPISPEELLAEWEFYFPELEAMRKGKNIQGQSAISYDLAILLAKNAEYRELMAKKKIEEHIKEAEKDIVPDVDHSIMARLQQNAQKQKRNNRRSELFKEIMGNGD